MPFSIRLATPADAEAILSIYSYYITQTVITFEKDVPSAADFAARIADIQTTYPYLVCEADGVVVGYAYAARQGARAAFRWNVELSVYVAQEFQSQGIASRLYRTLLRILTAQGFQTAYVRIVYPHPVSIAFHERFGFEELALFRRTGYKLGRWCDLLWMQKPLADYRPEPPEPTPIAQLASLPQLLREANEKEP